MQSKRIGVLMGGTSPEREVSLASARAVAGALRERGHRVVPLEIDSLSDAWDRLRLAHIDAAFLALHGTFGADGCMQGMLEMLSIPYTGSSVLASALAMDKLKAKELFRLHNVPTPPYYVVGPDVADSGIPELHGVFGFPAIVKPRRESSSVGLAKVESAPELVEAVHAAREYDECVLVERFVRGRELAVAILDGRVLGAIEISPKGGIYDSKAKTTPGGTEYFLPARLAAARYRGVLNLAEQAARAVDASGAVRVDILATEGMNESVLEVNTLPDLTETSLVPRIAEAAGYSFGALCEAILGGARLHTHASRELGRIAGREVELEAPRSTSLPLAVSA